MLVDEVLFGYQQEASRRIAEQRKVLLADQPGLGKTLEVLGGLELAGELTGEHNILILTPIINAQTAWIDTLEKFVMPKYDINVIDVSHGTIKQKSSRMQLVADKPNIVVANHNAIDAVKDVPRVPELGDVLFDAIVIDESHMVLPIRDTRKLTQFWKGLRHIRRTEDCIRIAVSGTPDRGKLENRYGTWRFLDRENTSQNRWDWLEQNFHMYDQKVSYNRTVKMVGHLKNRDRWVKKDQELVIRRTKQEVLAELPAKRYVDVEIPMSKEQLKGYYELKEQAEKEEMNPMVFATRARQWATCSWADLDGVYTPQYKGGSNKLDWLLEWLDSRGYMDGVNEGKVVISSQFSQVLHWLRAELENKGLNVGLLDGSTAQNLRIEQQRKFQEPNRDLSIMLLSGHMGVGITLDIADDLIMFDVPYDPDKIEQIEDRVHRASNMHKVTITTLISRATIDQPIMNKVTKRYKITRDLLDGERGIDFERRVVDDVINVPAGV